MESKKKMYVVGYSALSKFESIIDNVLKLDAAIYEVNRNPPPRKPAGKSTSAAFNNPHQLGLDKITHPPYGRGSGDIDFHSTKPYFTAPAISSEECDDSL